MRRRPILATAAALAGSSSTAPLLAADEGKPVRGRPLRSTYYGPEFYDEAELTELRDVLTKRQPFRSTGASLASRSIRSTPRRTLTTP